MIELFAIIKEQKAAHLQIRCENLSFFRCDTPTELIEYLKGRLDYYTVEHFEVNISTKHLDAIDIVNTYISSFSIDLYMSKEEYDFINSRYHTSIAKYNMEPINIERYRFKYQE